MSGILYNGSGNVSSVNCTNLDNQLKRFYLPVMYSVIFIVGVIGNTTALLVYFVKVRPWRSSTIIMVNLALTDLIFMISLPFLTYYYTSDESWNLDPVLCRFFRFIFHFNLYGSILFLSCAAIFRYVAVVHPLHTHKIKQKRWGFVACLLVWIVTIAEVSPIFNLFQMDVVNNQTKCLDLASSYPESVWPHSWVLTVLGYLVPLVVVCLCYWRIILELKKGPHTKSKKRLRARRLIVLILTCFIVCFLPYHVLRAFRIYTQLKPNSNCMLKHGVHAAYIISRPIAALNIIFNLVLYTLSGDCFKKAFSELFRCKRILKRTKGIVRVAVISKPNSNTQEQRN